MVTKRASKRRRKNPNDPTEEENEVQPPQAGIHEDGEKSFQGSAKKDIGKESPVIVLAHGAGAPSSSDWMIRWKGMLAKALNAIEVVAFDYPYIAGGKKRAPPKAEKLVDFHCDIVRRTMAKYPGHPLVLAGKSMGSRVSCMVAGEKDIAVSSIVCLGYPLKGMEGYLFKEEIGDINGSICIVFCYKKSMGGAVRDATLLQLTVPVMFVQGSKDGLCPLEKLEAVRKKMDSINALHVIDGGDHSFKIAKKHLQSTGSNQVEEEEQAVQAIATFVSRCLKDVAS